MTKPGATPDLMSDPFGESCQAMGRKRVQILGGRFEFESNNRELLRLVDSAYSGLPAHRVSPVVRTLRVKLLLGPRPRSRTRGDPPALDMLSGPALLGAASDSSNLVMVCPREGAALVVVSPQMLEFAYHTRYEMIEFAVFTLAARALGLVPLHAACIARRGRGLLLMGPSGSGKSTIALQCLVQGWDFLAEDGVFVAPSTLLATGVANFLHIRSESLRWLARSRDAEAIRRSPIIRRRSGVKKYEVDLRRSNYRLAARPPKVAAVVFLSSQSAGSRPLLRPLTKSDLIEKLTVDQVYAASRPEWKTFVDHVSRLSAFELRRGRHPLQAVDALQTLLESAHLCASP
jgi:hypothetical protein